jgi:transposase
MQNDYMIEILKRYEAQEVRIEELEAENGALRNENQELREEIKNLGEKCAELERRMEERIEKAVAAATAALYVQLREREKEIERLKAKIGKDSTNSSKPPSTDVMGKKVRNNRERSEREVGGQPGHKGHTLRVPNNLSELAEQGKIKLKIEDHTNGATEYVTSYTVGIETQVVWTEHRHKAGTRVTYVQYDASVKAFCVLLTEGEFVSIERTSEILELITNGQIAPSIGTIRNYIEESTAGSMPRYGELGQEILNSGIVHTDETPVRCTERLEIDDKGKESLETAKGKTFQVFIRVYSTLRAAYYTLNAHKGDAGIMRDGILATFLGILCHDHDKKLYKYGTQHGACNAHLLRDLKGLAELWQVEWANKFRKLLVNMNEYKKTDIASCKSPPVGCRQTDYEKFSETWDALLQEGTAALVLLPEGSFRYNELRRMIARLTNFKQEYMLFLQNYSVHFTNNLAERDLRHCKTKQKVSNSFRSWKGALNYVIIWSIIASAKNKILISLMLSLILSLLRLFP